MGVEELWEEFTSNIGIKEIITSSKGYVWPLPGYSDISSNFGERFHPIKKVNSFHDGIDIPAPQGTEVVSPGSGTGFITMTIGDEEKGYSSFLSYLGEYIED